ncbi:MAG: beta-ketoacyl-ACP synthase III [Pseudanabaenaceae cyanobacterium]
MITTGVRIWGYGAAVPARRVTNDDLSRQVETTDAWIQERTGIRERRVLGASESLALLAAQAGQQALTHTGLTPNEVDLILLATSTPDDLFGSAPQVQALLGATRALAFDLTAACSGFAFALLTAAQFVQTGTYQNVLVIGADTLSRWVDWSDRRTCILFGDGAGAVVVSAAPVNHWLGWSGGTNGQDGHLLALGYREGGYGPVDMNGREVYRFAVKTVPEVLEKALYQAGLTIADVDWWILHQANQRILDAVTQRLGIDPAQTVSHLGDYGNTSAASIPLALADTAAQGRLQPGHIVAIAGFGAGLSWGGAVFRWG